MGDQQMNSTRRARRILDAWERMDLAGIEAELALAECDGVQTGGSSCEEQERLGLVERDRAAIRQDFSRLPGVD